MAPEVFRNAKYTVTWRGNGKTMDNPENPMVFICFYPPHETPRINMDQPGVPKNPYHSLETLESLPLPWVFGF
jgi:hypothetical protein